MASLQNSRFFYQVLSDSRHDPYLLWIFLVHCIHMAHWIVWPNGKTAYATLLTFSSLL